MRLSKIVAGAALAFLAATTAIAQTPGESAVVQELQVTKRLPGPALWKAAKGDAELYIVGAVTPLRHLQQWDTSRVENALQDAVVLLLPPKAKLGLMDLVSLSFNKGVYKLPGGATLDQTLPPSVRDRLWAKVAQFKSDRKKYDSLKPAAAGVQLIADFREAAGLSDAKPGSTLIRLAKARGVPYRAVAEYDLKALIDAAGRLSPQAQVACLEDAMAEVDFEAAQSVPAGAAWATGDLAGVHAHYRANGLDRCLKQAPSLDALVERTTADTARALNEVLNRPGKVVAVVDLALMLRPNGVLDRLKAQGAEITVPNR